MRRNAARLLALALTLATAPMLACTNRPVTPATVTPQTDEELHRIAEGVNQALTSKPPRGYEAIPKGVRLLGVDRKQDGSITLNFSEELLAPTDDRRLEDAVHQILTAAAEARGPQTDGAATFRVLINGVTLEAYRP